MWQISNRFVLIVGIVKGHFPQENENRGLKVSAFVSITQTTLDGVGRLFPFPTEHIFPCFASIPGTATLIARAGMETIGKPFCISTGLHTNASCGRKKGCSRGCENVIRCFFLLTFSDQLSYWSPIITVQGCSPCLLPRAVILALSPCSCVCLD